MKLWTVQMAKHRLCAERGILLLDTTFRSKDPTFSPTKEIVYGIKYNGMSEGDYTNAYTDLMRASYRNNQARWLEVCNMDEVAIACMCPSGVFCHRHVLRRHLEATCGRLQIPFMYMGEIE